MEFDFDYEKNKLLLERRGVSFFQVIEVITEKGVLIDIEHPNKLKYPNQRMFVVEINNYTYSVPYVIDKNRYWLKTIYPNRKFQYLLEKEDEDER